MAFWNKKKTVDVNKPVKNPGLKKAFREFNSNKNEPNLQLVISELNKANFLALIQTDELKSSPSGRYGKMLFEKGSKIKFLKTYNENNDAFQPLFTDWSEVDLWVESRDNLAGWIMKTSEVFEFVFKHTSDKGIVINPCSDKWDMDKEQIAAFLTEFK